MKVIFIDTVHPVLKERLESKGIRCMMHQKTTPRELVQLIGHYDGIVIRSRIPLNKDFLSKATQLKFIARSGAGLENIDLEYCRSKGIVCFNSPEGNKDAVGEHAIGMLLSLLNNLNRGDREVRNGEWNREKNRGTELGSKTIGIIGYGNMGSAFAEKLSGFGCRILAHDKYKSGFGNHKIEESTLETIYANADIISLHLPCTAETKYYFNLSFAGQMKKNFYLINTARGLNVNTADLVEGLKTGKVLGACLDVIEYEDTSFEKHTQETIKEPWQYLLQSEQVMLSPHVAGWTTESYYKLSSVLADKIIAHFGLDKK